MEKLHIGEKWFFDKSGLYSQNKKREFGYFGMKKEKNIQKKHLKRYFKWIKYSLVQ